MESNLALVITTIKIVPNSLVSSANQYLRIPLRSNFIAVLCDGSADSADVEKESIYVLLVDLDTFQPTLSFLYLKDIPSQDTDGIVKAIKSAFSIHDLRHFLQKIVFIASDGASVNSGLKGGIAANFRKEEELSWLSFIWCLSH